MEWLIVWGMAHFVGQLSCRKAELMSCPACTFILSRSMSPVETVVASMRIIICNACMYTVEFEQSQAPSVLVCLLEGQLDPIHGR